MRPVSWSVVTVVAIAVTTLLTSCATTPETDYSNARAQLDPATSQVELPLEKYAMDAAEVRDVEHANALLAEECMAGTGRDFPRARQNWDSLPEIPDRRYGVWTITDAQTNGYEAPISESDSVSAVEESFDDKWWAAARSCVTEDYILELRGVNTSANESPVDRGMNESYAALMESDQFESARAAWVSCIEAEGLNPFPDAPELVPEFPAAGEEQIRIATIDVECKDKLGTVQTLADIETRDQLQYVDQHESELAAFRDEAESILDRARDIIATNGD